MRLFGEAGDRFLHAIEEKSSGFLPVAVAVRRGNQLLRLGHGESSEKTGEYRP